MSHDTERELPRDANAPVLKHDLQIALPLREKASVNTIDPAADREPKIESCPPVLMHSAAREACTDTVSRAIVPEKIERVLPRNKGPETEAEP